MVERRMSPSLSRARPSTASLEHELSAQPPPPESPESPETTAAVVFVFRNDLRLQDNRSLAAAWHAANSISPRVPLLTVYLLSPAQLKAEYAALPDDGRGRARLDFVRRTLSVLQRDLSVFDIPLYMETVRDEGDDWRDKVPDKLVDLCDSWCAKRLFANFEYEPDCLHRDIYLARLCANKGIRIEMMHDSCMVPPGAVDTTHTEFDPWYPSWLVYLNHHPDAFDFSPRVEETDGNSNCREKFGSLFLSIVPEPPKDMKLPSDERKRLTRAFPASEYEAIGRLRRFLTKQVMTYGLSHRLDEPNTSTISPYLAVGALSTRTAVALAKEHNGNRLAGTTPVMAWIRNIARWDFCHHTCTETLGNLKTTPWCTSPLFDAWTAGRTGTPIVDAVMRQLKYDAWLSNTSRYVAAAYLIAALPQEPTKRAGERYFLSYLIDADLANNSAGWAQAAAVVEQASPSSVLSDVVRQSEQFDPEGQYVRLWVPELADIEGNAIHDPHARGAGAEAKANNYPIPVAQPHVTGASQEKRGNEQ